MGWADQAAGGAGVAVSLWRRHGLVGGGGSVVADGPWRAEGDVADPMLSLNYCFFLFLIYSSR